MVVVEDERLRTRMVVNGAAVQLELLVVFGEALGERVGVGGGGQVILRRR